MHSLLYQENLSKIFNFHGLFLSHFSWYEDGLIINNDNKTPHECAAFIKNTFGL